MKRYRIHVVAELTGLSEGLLRAWERRYGVLEPERTESGYRAYSEFDVEVLRELKALTESGVSIAEAAKSLPRLKREVRARLGPSSATPPTFARLSKWMKQLVLAAERLDQEAVERVLDEASHATDPVTLFDRLLAPLQTEAGERWHQGSWSVAEEHLVTAAVRELVMSLLQRAPRRAKRHVVCACFPEEQHELGLMGAALKFRHHGWRVTFLGARTPPEHLGKVVRITRPELIALSAIADPGATAFARALEAMMEQRGKASVVLGGRAAERHAALVEKAGARLISTEAQWASLE